MYKSNIIDCSWGISNSFSKFISTYPSHIVFKSNWILGSVPVLSVPVLIRSANSLTYCEPLHFYLWTSIVNLYTVPHFFFIDFRKFDSTRECIFYIVFRGFCKSTKVTRMEKFFFTFLVIACVYCMQIKYSWFYSEFHFFGPSVISQQTDL